MSDFHLFLVNAARMLLGATFENGMALSESRIDELMRITIPVSSTEPCDAYQSASATIHSEHAELDSKESSSSDEFPKRAEIADAFDIMKFTSKRTD